MLLDKISKMDSHVLRGLMVAGVGLVGSVVALFGHISAAQFMAKALPVIDSADVLLGAAGLAWAAYARVNLPNPPLSNGAIVRRDAAVAAGKLQTREPTIAPAPALDNKPPAGNDRPTSKETI